MNKRKFHHLWPFLLVIAGPILLYLPMLARGEVLYWGTPLLQFVPWREAALEMLAAGYLPLWNPSLGMGAPLLANHQTAVFYLPNLLLALLGPAWGHGFLNALHLAWAGCGMVVLMRRLSGNGLAQAIAGLSFSLCGYLVARSGFPTIIAAAAWLPWAIAAADRLARHAAGRRRASVLGMGALFLAIVLAMLWLAGHAQTAWYSTLLTIVYAFWRSVESGGWKGLLRVLPWMAAAGGLAIGFAALQLLPTIEYLANSQRAGLLDSTFAMTYSLWPWSLTGLLFPDLFGNPVYGNFWGYGNYWEGALYIGTLPLILAISAMVRGFAKRGVHWRLRRFLALVGASSLLLALGENTPIFPWLFAHVPTFGLFQAPARWDLLLVFSLALLAGLGAAEWPTLSKKDRYWINLGTVGASVIVLVSLAATWALPQLESTFVPAIALGGAWLLVVGLLYLRKPNEPSGVWSALACGVVLANLLLAGIGLNPAAPAGLYEGKSHLGESVGPQHRLYMPADLEYELKFEEFFRFDAFLADVNWSRVREIGLPNTPALDDLRSANNFDPLMPGRYAAWMESLAVIPPSSLQRLLRLMDVGWMAEEDAAGKVGYVELDGAARVRVVGQAVGIGTAEEALSAVLDDNLDIDQAVVLETRMPSTLAQGGGGEANLIETVDPNRVLVQVSTQGGGWLVLSDVWYPGWQAFVDGEATEILRADYLFRAVWVPDGEHRVEFRYLPRIFILGALISGLTVMLGGGLAWRWRRN
jgi:hypothetical protein